MKKHRQISHAILLKGAGISGFGIFFSQGITLLSGLIVARLLGPADYGIFNIVRNFAITTSVFTKGGFDIGIMRRLGELGNKETDKDIGQLVASVCIVVLVMSIIPVLLCAGGVSQYLESTTFKYAGFANLLTTTMLIVPCWSLIQTMGGVFRGRLKLWPAILGEYIVQPVARLILSVALILAGYGIWGVVWGNIMAAGMVVLYVLSQGSSEFAIFKQGVSTSVWKDTVNLGQYSMVLAISVAIVTLTKSLDVLVLGKYVSSKEVGCYAIVQMMVLVISMIGSSFGQLLGPIVASMWREERHHEIEKTLRQNTRWISLVAAPAFIAISWLGSDLIKVFGRGYIADGKLVILLASSQMVTALFSNAGWILSMTGRHVQETVSLFLGLVVAVVLNIVLIPLYGTLGAATATLAAIVVGNCARIIVIYRSAGMMPISIAAGTPILVAVFLAVVINSIANLLGISWTLLSAILICLMYGASYVVICYWVILDSEERAMATARIMRHRVQSLL